MTDTPTPSTAAEIDAADRYRDAVRQWTDDGLVGAADHHTARAAIGDDAAPFERVLLGIVRDEQRRRYAEQRDRIAEIADAYEGPTADGGRPIWTGDDQAADEEADQLPHRLVTVTATVYMPGRVTDPAAWRQALAEHVREALAFVGARLVPCDWAPDPDTIAEACGLDPAHEPVTVLDLNPARNLRHTLADVVREADGPPASAFHVPGYVAAMGAERAAQVAEARDALQAELDGVLRRP